MIAVVDSIQNGKLICQLDSFHTIWVAQSSLSFHAREGDILQFRNGQWNPLPHVKTIRLSHIHKLMQDLFI